MLLFILAVLGVIAAVNLIVSTVLVNLDEEPGMLIPDGRWLAAHPGTLTLTSLLVLAVVGLSSLYKVASLREGGGVVARNLGGMRIERTLDDPLRRRLFNVVEEMAIASGVPMPEVYVLEQESAINAFAAGHSPANAAIAVTRGALEKLNRAELQGVVAHEFGHVLNGDMKLNTQMIGVVFGLLVVALIGRTVLRFAPRGSGKKGGAGAVVLVALAVMILGYIGVFFGRLIQAAVSRQRERLADASAVQFTREPQGLKGALVKIGAQGGGSKLADANAEEVAHMLFASGTSRLFATHPPLQERIRALDPHFDPAEFARVRFDPQVTTGTEQRPSLQASVSAAQAAQLASVALAPAAVAGLVGNPGTLEVEVAAGVARSLPRNIVATLDVPGRAEGTALALTLDSRPQIRQQQLDIVSQQLGSAVLAHIAPLQVEVASLAPMERVALLGEVFPALRRLPREERMRLLACLERLIVLDGRIDMFEYALATLARVYLEDELQPNPRRHSLKLEQTSVELQTVFSTLARHGGSDETSARHAYELGLRHVLPASQLPYQPVAGWPQAMDRALKCLDRLVPAAKEKLIEALVRTIGQDGRMTPAEAELLRAICASLHCPLPPLVAK